MVFLSECRRERADSGQNSGEVADKQALQQVGWLQTVSLSNSSFCALRTQRTAEGTIAKLSSKVARNNGSGNFAAKEERRLEARRSAAAKEY